MGQYHPQMTADDVVEIVQLFERHHLPLCIDGGWGVDALLGVQTRPHLDLDIAVPHLEVSRIRALLEARGYRDVPRDDTRDCNFVLGDDQRRLIDIHTYIFDAEGRCIYGCAYPYDSLLGRGSINGHPVTCITPEWMVKFHTGYLLDEDDYHDVKSLCQRFGLALPAEYDRFEATP